ncbi:MAG: pyruvate kinase [Candidatus Omnitrophica bacterium]|nr:pyruvate kinase [Candidatus Omnitrophota bacterium]
MIRTKIMATLGPASTETAVLRKMFVKGLDAVRLNFSHGTHQEHISRIHNIRALNKQMRRHIKIMQDLEGYRIRVGEFKGPLNLEKRQTLYLTQESNVQEPGNIPFDYLGRLTMIKPGNSIFIDDGRIVLAVKAVEKKRIKTVVAVGGWLKPNKGINIPGVELEFDALTEKDKADLKVAIDYKLDYLAQSFVRCAEDLKSLKKIVKPELPDCLIFAKIENQQALDNLDEIIEAADGIIVARGDLGICLPIYKVPVLQKEIIKKCLIRKRPVVVATQMLDSMTESVLPTRAEVSDVANAILDGSTHLMLSGETAVGLNPARVVDMMNKVIKYTENYQLKLKDVFA